MTWHFKARPSRTIKGEFIAWCAKTEELGDGPLDVAFDLEVHFEFGSSEDEALSKLRKEVLN